MRGLILAAMILFVASSSVSAATFDSQEFVELHRYEDGYHHDGDNDDYGHRRHGDRYDDDYDDDEHHRGEGRHRGGYRE